MDLGLSAIEPLLGETEGSARKEAALAILNGVVGDYLTKTNNPLAIQMRLQMVGNEDASSSNNNTRRYLIVIHGACNGPQDWWQQGHNHGIELAAHLDYVPLFLQYNTGLHISENGKLLNDLLKELIIAAVDNNSDVRISILAHSMGGLVARSACHYAAATQDTSCWLSKVDRLVTLGTPHHGAILERGGKLVDAVLGAHRYTEPLSWLGKIRSNGVNDLGYGNVRDEDWMECTSTTGMEDCRKPTPLPAHVSCLAIAAVLGDENSSTNRLLRETYRTDGLVTEASAFGRGHENSELNLNFDETITIYNVSHVGLLHSKEVYKNVLCFLSG
jgi:pimeloyl-ACP methyl ester carboxylesterase